MKFKKSELITALKTSAVVRPEFVAIYPRNGELRINAQGRGFGGVIAQSTLKSEEMAVDEASFQVAFDRFRAIVDAMPGDVVTIALDGNSSAHVASGRTRLRIAAVYDPAIDEIDTNSVSNAETICSFDGSVLSGAIGLVSHAMAENDVRFFLNGMHVHVRKDGGTDVVATDGPRMVINRIKAKNASTEFRVTMAPSAVHLLKSMSGEGDVELAIVGKTLIAKRGDWLCRMALYDEYAKGYERIIPKTCSSTFDVSRLELAASFRRVMVANEDRKHQSVLASGDGSGNIVIALASDATSKDEITVPQCSAFEYAVNGDYVTDFLAACQDDTVQVSIEGDNRMIIAPKGAVDHDSSAYVSVIMGMRV